MTEKNVLTNTEKADNIWEKLKERAKKIGYGSFDCVLTVHDGEVKQLDIRYIEEKIRADEI